MTDNSAQRLEAEEDNNNNSDDDSDESDDENDDNNVDDNSDEHDDEDKGDDEGGDDDKDLRQAFSWVDALPNTALLHPHMYKHNNAVISRRNNRSPQF
jgi:hypothetical protein